MLLVTVAVLLGVAHADGGAHQTPLESGLVEESRVDVVQDWPVLVLPGRPKHAEHCASLGPEDLALFEDGREMQVLSVDRAASVTTNVLMLDTSASMTNPWRKPTRRRALQTKAAASAFVEWLRQDRERLMVVTFDDDLLLQSPATVVEDERVQRDLQRSVAGITGGFYTTLNDSLARLTDHLEGRPGRSAVILLSDGADRASIRSSDAALELVELSDSLTVFPIGIGLDDGLHQRFLEDVASASGGHYYWLRDRRAAELGRPLEKKFRDIRERLSKQVYVSYLAEPFGALPGDTERADELGRTRRKVKIVSRDRRCEIPASGYRPTRTVRREAVSPLAPAQPNHWILESEDESATIGTTIDDLVRDSNPLIRYEGETTTRKIARREVRVEVPAFERRFDDAGLEHVLHRWLVEGSLPANDDGARVLDRRDGRFPIAREMNGNAFLERRVTLAQAVFDTRPAYRDWATTRFEARLRSELRARFEAISPGGANDEAALAAAVAERVSRIAPDDYVPFLADWLEDVPARELALSLEALEIRRLLGAFPSTDPEVEHVQREWPRLHRWLRLPDLARVTTPLSLACDDARDTCGYRRVVLPRLSQLPEVLEKRHAALTTANLLVPDRPWALIAVRDLIGSGDSPIAIELRDKWTVTAVDHRLEDPGIDLPADEAAPSPCDLEIAIDLRNRETDANATLRIRADGGDGGPGWADGTTADPPLCEIYEPRCLELDGNPTLALGEAIESTGLARCDEMSP
jgi:Mg-chelatase subunit ChlD